MEKWVLIVEVNCTDPAREQEFNDWYNNTHLPDMIELPSVVRATRYENLNPGEGDGKYFAVYEMAAADFDKAMDELAAHVKEKAEQGRMSSLMQVTRRVRAKQILSK